MNKSDLKLLLILLLIVVLLIISTIITKSNNPKNALVYYENNLVLSIDLEKRGINYYEVDGALGLVKIETSDGKIRVAEENSPNNICSKQGFIQNSYEVLVCLPNKVVIKIEEKSEIDTIVK